MAFSKEEADKVLTDYITSLAKESKTHFEALCTDRRPKRSAVTSPAAGCSSSSPIHGLCANQEVAASSGSPRTILEAVASKLPAHTSATSKMGLHQTRDQGRRYRSPPQRKWEKKQMATREGHWNHQRTWWPRTHHQAPVWWKGAYKTMSVNCAPWGAEWQGQAHWIKRLIQCVLQRPDTMSGRDLRLRDHWDCASTNSMRAFSHFEL